MSDLVVVVYPSEQKAEEIRQRLFELQKEYLIKIGDAVIATKDEKGHVKLNQLMNTTAAGAASGSLWGLLIGAVFLMPLVGVVLGAASGALGGALTDYGINDKFMKDLGESLQPGSAALFVLVQEVTGDKVLEELRGSGGTVLKTSLDHSKEQALREALAAQPLNTPAPAAPSA
ncbi:Putative membrane protein [Hyphomicrobiales bacterium]|nr:Putative membrane protein [Hyphomicrobiales bacterium]CAH1666659.1 putative membrane protein [Hyphomicrobiales bacterium]